jgi:hypothetical protein
MGEGRYIKVAVLYHRIRRGNQSKPRKWWGKKSQRFSKDIRHDMKRKKGKINFALSFDGKFFLYFE